MNMNTKRLLLVTLILVFAALAVIPTTAQDTGAATPEPTAAATTEPIMTATTGFFVDSLFVVNVRSGPGTEYTILGKLRPESSLDITGRNDDSTWIRVNFNGQEGWVAASVSDVTGDLATATVAEAGATAVLRAAAAPSAQTTVTSDVVATALFNVNLREAPTTNSARLVTIPFNSQLGLLSRSEDGNWVQVQFNNITGWVAENLLTFTQGNFETLPIMLPDGSLTFAEQATPAPVTSDTSASTSP
jgi:uncharacterized protein YraI